MRLNRLRPGELITLVGAVGLLVLMFLHWFRPSDSLLRPQGGFELPPRIAALANQRVGDFTEALARSGWSSLGWFAALVLALAIVVALASVLLTLTQDSPALPVASEIFTTTLGLLATLTILFRMVFQPGLGFGLDDAHITVLAPAWLGLLCAVLITAGGWIALKDERTDAPAARQPDVELRPIPPTR